MITSSLTFEFSCSIDIFNKYIIKEYGLNDLKREKVLQSVDDKYITYVVNSNNIINHSIKIPIDDIINTISGRFLKDIMDIDDSSISITHDAVNIKIKYRGKDIEKVKYMFGIARPWFEYNSPIKFLEDTMELGCEKEKENSNYISECKYNYDESYKDLSMQCEKKKRKYNRSKKSNTSKNTKKSHTDVAPQVTKDDKVAIPDPPVTPDTPIEVSSHSVKPQASAIPNFDNLKE